MSDAYLTDNDCMGLTSTQVKASVARALIAALTAECKTYCLLSGFDMLPDSFETDIDFMVDRQDFERIPKIIDNVAKQTRTRLFHSVEHELTAHAFLLGSLSGATLTIAQLDAASDFRHFGSLWLRASDVLRQRRLHPCGFWIPSAADEFVYCLIKRLNKRKLSPLYSSRLHRLYNEDRSSCDQRIARFWKGQQSSALSRMSASNDWAEMDANLESFREQLMRNAAESLPQKVVSSWKRTAHFMSRLMRPTGAWIAFIGPDGSGKSMVISRINEQFAPAFRGVIQFHMRPKFFGPRHKIGVPVTDPHGKKPRGELASIAKILYYTIDYLVGYVFQIAPALIRTRLILFDRYIYDLQIDSKRVRYGGPKWLLRLASRFVPHPELVILLDAPAEVLWLRKQEVPLEEVSRQRAAYLQLTRTLSCATIVDAAQPVVDVVREAADAILAHLASRSEQRLGLQPSPLHEGGIEADAPHRQC